MECCICVHGDHLSENAGEFDSCQGYCRELTKFQGSDRKKLLSCQSCILLTSRLWLHQCLVNCCRPCIVCFKDFAAMKSLWKHVPQCTDIYDIYLAGSRKVAPWILMKRDNSVAVAAAGPYANRFHLTPDRLNVFRLCSFSLFAGRPYSTPLNHSAFPLPFLS